MENEIETPFMGKEGLYGAISGDIGTCWFRISVQYNKIIWGLFGVAGVVCLRLWV